MILSAPLPMQLFWGPHFIVLYNDALIPAMTDKHPGALGLPAREAWAEAWDIVGPQMQSVRESGNGLYHSALLVPIRREGTVQDVYWDYSYSPMYGPNGEVEGVLDVVRDVTETVLAEKARRESDERLDLAMEAAELGMWFYDPETGVVVADDRMHRIFGSPAPSGSVTYWLDLLHPEDSKLVGKHFQEALQGRHVYDLEYRIVRPEGVHWIRSKGRVVGAPGQPERMFAVVEDVTEQKRAEDALIQAEKLAAVGRLAASIAHEINNPLESVTNLLYLARTTNELAGVQEYLELAERELRRVSVISNQTLRFHKQSSNPRAVTCEDLFESVLSIYQGRLVNSHVRVEKDRCSLEEIECFDGEIRQILNNLVGNAIDAMHPGGGRLIVRSRRSTDWVTGRKGVTLTVADTGVGMPQAVLKKVFEAFYTTKGIGGTGLGLWVSNEIVHRHHGALRVRSSTKEGRSGTVFTLFLPEQAVIRLPVSPKDSTAGQ